MISKMYSSAVRGIDAIVVEVEVDISFGMPVFQMVGLAETAVRESRERVRSAVQNAGYSFPMDRVVVNLAPADVKKEGTGLDLPVALGILCASGLFSQQASENWIMAGELSLDGRLKPVKAALPFALAARDNGFKGIILPEENGAEAALVKDIEVMGVSHLSQVVEFLAGRTPIVPAVPEPGGLSPAHWEGPAADFAHVRGQAHVKRALEVGAAGNHHILMDGPAGSGKSMMAKCLPGILPLPTFEEAMETARIYSITGAEPGRALMERPFRSPHHSISDAGLVGGGTGPVPGEISLAHNGVLFLDELPEFRRNALEVLRQPLEEGRITLARAKAKATYPCRFMLVGAMNPCICGNFTNPAAACTCTPAQIRRYRSKVSGPLLDRMDIQVEVPRLSYDELTRMDPEESSAAIRERVVAARELQQKRFNRTAPCYSNAQMGPEQIREYCGLEPDSETILRRAVDRLNLSARAWASILKVARTIADLAHEARILRAHILEAVQYRNFERKDGMP
ncbi:MAG: YifB family Mg chelatase-like AAA ATPase [Desulfobacter sp.]|nr:MAG: YifB family Mg chelatase-like AAA ATPase [Desulfobacter sp.]